MNKKILTEYVNEGIRMLEILKRGQLKRCENSSQNLG